ncbi:RibD domain protein [Aspergillus sclerotialis]|uniref:2,5-diamino-6-ribosylamino-4(3H)-pyrimidinone 5'-phosphate reductase n=1 Tax=Aspergillus sclerotialis TaxID=2070753 RepID=A0A3A2ZUA4_9EURO|nr:RibD domain protein [Aspergillus sclerotialis]
MSPRTWTGRVFIATSLDGFIARPDGDISWLTNPPADPVHLPPTLPRTVKVFDQHMARVDCILMGRKTYEKVLSLPQWPYGTKPIFVLSSTSLEEAGEVFERDRIGSVYVDGGEVVQAFLRKSWVDEIILTHAPMLLGQGIPLFGFLEKDIRMSLRAVDVIEDGMVSAEYQVIK